MHRFAQCRALGFLLLVILSMTVLNGLLAGDASAQSFRSLFAALPLPDVEDVVGPLVPPTPLGNTFRSEMGFDMASGTTYKADLTAPGFTQFGNSGEWDLTDWMKLETSPNKYEFRGNIRWWRFGARASYSFFENRSTLAQMGALEFNGLGVGGDFDVVHLPKLSIGVGGDYYFIDPRLRSRIMHTNTRKNPSTGEVEEYDIEFGDFVVVKGDRPATANAYARYLPPEILGFPAHLEAFYAHPITETKVQSLGVAVVLRPQIYRFDVAAKFTMEQRQLTFEGIPEAPAGIGDPWEVNAKWRFYSVQTTVYF